MSAKSAKEQSEDEVEYFLKQTFKATDIEPEPKVNGKKADFLVKSIDVYIEVHAIRDIVSDLINVESKAKNVKLVTIKDSGEEKIADRIASKLLHECTQLPDGKMNLIVTKTEGRFVSSDDIIDVLIGKPHLVVAKTLMATQVELGNHGFRTEEELDEVLQKISAIIAYEGICEHGKLIGLIGNNKNNAKVPFSNEIADIFGKFLCDKCK